MLKRLQAQPVGIRVLRGLLLAALCSLAAYSTPTPFLLEAPGRSVPVSEMIAITHASAHPVQGSYLMTTVLLEPATVLLCFYGLLDPDATLTRLPGAGLEEQAQSRGENRQMELSQYVSTRVALERLGYKVNGDYQGLAVVALANDSPNRNRLQVGDVIEGLDGQSAPTLQQLQSALTQKSSLTARVRRQGSLQTVNLETMTLHGQRRLGAILRPDYAGQDLPVDVRFQSGNTSGASAGVVFALEIYDRLAPEDLARGRRIAATGTLDLEGRIGPVEGVPMKLISAERAGADLFLIPQENWPEVSHRRSSVRIIAVNTIEEAIDALR